MGGAEVVFLAREAVFFARSSLLISVGLTSGAVKVAHETEGGPPFAGVSGVGGEVDSGGEMETAPWLKIWFRPEGKVQPS